MAATGLTQRFKSRFRGEIIVPGDAGYDAARAVFNAAIDRRPTLIARCANVEHVSEAVKFARESRLPVAVRGTGHNVAGYAVCDDGIVIDLSPMKGIAVDRDARTVRVEAGCNWGEVADALQPHGLAATGGFVSITGVGGLTLGGGLGWLVRKHGLALDNLLSAEMVLADGSRVVASTRENPELFWAIRGGGGNFGIVTSFVFAAHPAGMVLAGIVLHPAQRAADAIRCWRDLEATSPREATLGALLFHMPDDAALPPMLRRAPVVGLGGVYAGPIEDGRKVLRALREYGPPIADKFEAMPYSQAQRMADFLWPPGLRGYWKSTYLRALSDEAIDVVADFFSRVPSQRTVIVIEEYGNSAWSDVPEAATAFGSRQWPYNMVVTSAWSDPKETERNIAWTREFLAAMQPFAAPAAYVNYMGGDEGDDGIRAAYGAKLARLAELKARFDPTNLFHQNQNIAPATGLAK